MSHSKIYFSRFSAFFISIFFVFSMFLLQIIGVIIAAKIYFNDQIMDVASLIEIGSNNGVVIANSIFFTAITLSVFAFFIVFIRSGYRLDDTLSYFNIQKFPLKSFFSYLGLLIAFLIVSEGLLIYFDSQPLTLLDGLVNNDSLWLIIFAVTMIAPLYEEFIFRGLIFKIFLRKENDHNAILGLSYSTWLAVIVSSFLFALVHSLQYDLLSTIIIFFLAILFCHARVKHGLLLGVALHIINNILAMIMYLKDTFI